MVYVPMNRFCGPVWPEKVTFRGKPFTRPSMTVKLGSITQALSFHISNFIPAASGDSAASLLPMRLRFLGQCSSSSVTSHLPLSEHCNEGTPRKYPRVRPRHKKAVSRQSYLVDEVGFRHAHLLKERIPVDDVAQV